MGLHQLRVFASGSRFGGNFSSSYSFPVFILQCRSFTNYSGISFKYSTFNTHGIYGGCSLGKVTYTHRISTTQSKGLRSKVRHNSCFLKSISGGYSQRSALRFQTPLRIGFRSTMKNSNICASKLVENCWNLSSFISKNSRYFSVKAPKESQAQGKLINRSETVSFTHGKNEGAFTRINKKKKKSKSLVVQCSRHNSGQISLSSRNIPFETCKLIADAVEVLKPQKKVQEGDKHQDEKTSQVKKKSSKQSVKKASKAKAKEKEGRDDKKNMKPGSCSSVTTKGTHINQDPKSSHSVKKNVSKTSKLTACVMGMPKAKEQESGGATKNKKAENESTELQQQKVRKVGTKISSKKSDSKTCVSETQVVGMLKPLKEVCKGIKKSMRSPSDQIAVKSSSNSQGINLQKKKINHLTAKKQDQLSDSNTHADATTPLKVLENPTKKNPQNKAKARTKAAKSQINDAVIVTVKKQPSGHYLKPLFPPVGKSVVIVESLTKAKVIQGYLGNMYEVIPSYGHMRDLARKSGSVRPDDDYSVVWDIPSTAWTHLKSMKVALSNADNLILASDPDREGEAIAWHIAEMLQQQDALHEGITVARVVFHEITESSIKTALQSPRDIDADLVHAYLARRALDYLIGFNISPLLWRKLPGCQSAGRVQSVALAIICEREMEIDKFQPEEYWTVNVRFKKKIPGSPEQTLPSSQLTHFDSEKLDKLAIKSQSHAKDIEEKIISSDFKVVSCKNSNSRKQPPAPYITSTMQQDAANKLHFTALRTMILAQKLYEGVRLSDTEAIGLITYMRTDGMHVSDVAANDIRSLVIERYGNSFAAKNTRKFFKKVKNAQEAHEAIRPTDIRRSPSMLSGVLDEDSLKLYTLIWCRTMACQMEPAIISQIQIDFGDFERSLLLRSTRSTVSFLGFQAVYKDIDSANIRTIEKDAFAHEQDFMALCTLKVGDSVSFHEVILKQHSTQPPARFSEASLVKKLEELGIGRPSTYAAIMKVLQDRKYMTVKTRVLHPEFRGRMVSAFLSYYFSEVMDTSFTAKMETELDNVSAGTTEWRGLLNNYWTRFSEYCKLAQTVGVREVEKMLEEYFGDLLFTSLSNKSRACPSCSIGTLGFKASRFGVGYFLGCDQYPECEYIAKTMHGRDDAGDENTVVDIPLSEPKLLGLKPESDEKVLLKKGPYRYYLQLGNDKKGNKPKRVSLVTAPSEVQSITLEQALEMFSYPKILGDNPDDGKPVVLKLSKHGLTVRHGSTLAVVPETVDGKTITLESGLKLLRGPTAKRVGGRNFLAAKKK